MNSIKVKTIKELIDKKDLYEFHSYLEFNSIDINDVPKQRIDPLTYAIEIHAPDNMIKFLIEKYHTVNYETDQGKIPIYCALEQQNFAISEALLKGKKNGSADLNYTNRDNQNILTYLYQKNKLSKKTLNYCIRRGVNVNIQWSKKNSVLTQIIHSQKEGFEDIVKSLVYTTVFSNEFIIRFLTYSKTRKELTDAQLQSLIHEEKAKLNITKSVYKCVIDHGCINLLNLLFDHDIHFNLKTKVFDQLEGYGLMLRALLFNQYDIVNYLIHYGININMPYKKIFTPLTYAVYTHLDQVKFLVERGVDINATDGYGHTPLMIAAGYGRLKTVKYLIEHGADLHAKNPKGYDALLLSSKYGYFKVAKYLIDHGADIHATNNKGDSAFLLSLRHDDLDIVKYFIEHGVDINQKDQKGYNAIMLSAFFGNLDIIKYLIENGIDMYQTDNEGLTVVDFAYKGEYLYIVQYLVKYLNSLKDKDQLSSSNKVNETSHSQENDQKSSSKAMDIKELNQSIRCVTPLNNVTENNNEGESSSSSNSGNNSSSSSSSSSNNSSSGSNVSIDDYNKSVLFSSGSSEINEDNDDKA